MEVMKKKYDLLNEYYTEYRNSNALRGLNQYLFDNIKKQVFYSVRVRDTRYFIYLYIYRFYK